MRLRERQVPVREWYLDLATEFMELGHGVTEVGLRVTNLVTELMELGHRAHRILTEGDCGYDVGTAKW